MKIQLFLYHNEENKTYTYTDVNNKSIKTILHELDLDYSNIYTMVLNNQSVSLDYILKDSDKDSYLYLFHKQSKQGWKIYRNTLFHLFVYASKLILPDCKIKILHSLNKGLCCEFENIHSITQNQITLIKNKILELIDSSLPISEETLTKEELVSYLISKEHYDKIDLIRYSKEKNFKVYNLLNHKIYSYEQLLSNTKLIDIFDIKQLTENGVMLLIYNRYKPTELAKYKPLNRVLDIYEEQKRQATILNIDMLCDLNNKIDSHEYTEVVNVCEILHEKKIAQIAHMIKERGKRIILLSGPSSSGKTTSSKRICTHLKVLGLNPLQISLDNYFVNREVTPLDKYGKPDFESIYALDLKQFNADLNHLLKGEKVCLPTFCFENGCRKHSSQYTEIENDQPIVIEGIHALNNLLTSEIDDSLKFKIYVCPLTQLNLDYDNRISTTDIRLIRRIVRDSQFRGFDARRTLGMWDSVRRGEKKNIFPFQENADIMINSELTYELCVLKKYVKPLLEEISYTEGEIFFEAQRILNVLKNFKSVENEYIIPPTSLLREFIGGSCYN